jgi:hypothetical protein
MSMTFEQRQEKINGTIKEVIIDFLSDRLWANQYDLLAAIDGGISKGQVAFGEFGRLALVFHQLQHEGRIVAWENETSDATLFALAEKVDLDMVDPIEIEPADQCPIDTSKAYYPILAIPDSMLSTGGTYDA